MEIKYIHGKGKVKIPVRITFDNQHTVIAQIPVKYKNTVNLLVFRQKRRCTVLGQFFDMVCTKEGMGEQSILSIEHINETAVAA